MMKFLAASVFALALVGSTAAYAGLHLGGGHDRHDPHKQCYRHHHHHHRCTVDEFGNPIPPASTPHS